MNRIVHNYKSVLFSSILVSLLLMAQTSPLLKLNGGATHYESVDSADVDVDDQLTQSDFQLMNDGMGITGDESGISTFIIPAFFNWGDAESLPYIDSKVTVRIDADQRPDNVHVRLDTNDVSATLRGTETWDWLTDDPQLDYVGTSNGDYIFEGDVIVDLLFPTLFDVLYDEFYEVDFLIDVGICIVSHGIHCSGFFKQMFDALIHIFSEMLSNCIFPTVWIDEVRVDNEWVDVNRIEFESTKPSNACGGISDMIEMYTSSLESIHVVEYFLYEDTPSSSSGRSSTSSVELEVYRNGDQILPYTDPYVSFIDYGDGIQYVQIYNPNGEYEVRVVGNEDGRYTFGAIETKNGEGIVLDRAVDEPIQTGESKVASTQNISPPNSDGGGSTLVVILVIIILITVGVGGFLYMRRRPQFDPALMQFSNTMPAMGMQFQQPLQAYPDPNQYQQPQQAYPDPNQYQKSQSRFPPQ